MNYCTLVLEICLETTISYQSRDRNLLSNVVHLQNTLSVKLIRSLGTYYLASKELILKVSMFSLKSDISAFKPSINRLYIILGIVVCAKEEKVIL